MKFPLFKVHTDKTLALKNLEEVLDSGFLNEGEWVIELENQFKKYFNFNNLLAVNSCTSALTLALKISGVQEGDDVLTTSMTCVATNMPICNLGANPVWVDIDRNTGNIDFKNLEKSITKKTKALVCVNWAGYPCDLIELDKFCKDNNIKLIQDAAHSFGSTYKEKQLCHYSDFTCYSLQAIKHITSGDGGLLMCRNDEDFKRAKSLKWFGIDRESSKDEKGEWKGQRWETDIKEPGYKFHMNNISAAIGLSQIPHLEIIINSHRKNALLYERFLSDNDLLSFLSKPDECNPSYWVFTILLNNKINRDDVLESLNEIGIGAGVVHIPNHNYSCFSENSKDLPETDYFSRHQISLPCGWWLTTEDINLISNHLLCILKNEYNKYFFEKML